MSHDLITADDIDISREKQRELRERWVSEYEDWMSEYNFFTMGRVRNENIEDSDTLRLESRREELKSLCEEAVSYLPDDCTKKEKIVTIKMIFEHQKYTMMNSILTDVLDCHKTYTNDFERVENGVLHYKRITHSVRRDIRERDGYCVNCRSEENLTVHHIIPVKKGGSDEYCNLVTLCDKCHKDYHSYLNDGSNSHDPIISFNTWINTDYNVDFDENMVYRKEVFTNYTDIDYFSD